MKKILFVEDEPEQVMVISMRLEANGYIVISAQDGEEGLKKVFSEKPDLVLLDLVMPKMHGYEVARKIKLNDETKNLPIIVLTASGEMGHEEKCKQIGINEVLDKPYESEELLKIIKKYIG